MSDRVDAELIEGLVGVERHPIEHWGRAVSAEQRVYILHSQQCIDAVPDLRDCPFSWALDLGIDVERWVEDEPVRLAIEDWYLVPEEVSP
jgi:hypothetical protein